MGYLPCGQGLLQLFRPGDSPGQCALLVATGAPSPHPVPLRLLHFLRLPLGGENQTGTKSCDCSLTDGLLGVPHSHKNVVKEGLHLLEEEGGNTDGQLTENQDLAEKGKLRTLICIRSFVSLGLSLVTVGPLHPRKREALPI